MKKGSTFWVDITRLFIVDFCQRICKGVNLVTAHEVKSDGTYPKMRFFWNKYNPEEIEIFGEKEYKSIQINKYDYEEIENE